ncbi:hypothetical protein WH47_02923, partial [Habropoda laboriosa]
RVHEDSSFTELVQAEWVDKFQEDRNQLRYSAREQIMKIQAKNKKTYLTPKYMGPYTITRALRNDRYLVRRVGDQEGPLETSTAADHMKPWIEDHVEVDDSNSE